MKQVLFACLLLSACAETNAPMLAEPRRPEPIVVGTGDVGVRVPSQRNESRERQSADVYCAGYGRVARRQSGRDYDCVSAAQAARGE